MVVLAFAFPQASKSEIIYDNLDASSEVGEVALPAGIPLPVDTSLPGGYLVLNTFPNLWWSGCCTSTCGAMLVGHLSNSGFPEIAKKSATNESYLFPFGGYPNDNRIFLAPGDPIDKYYSDCDLSASRMGYFSRTEKGNIDDYFG
ncbi:MAG: hypothetical protein WCX73_06030, partial [Candidatus Pacearchaeota archaeon]